ncbi:Regulatory protein leu3 [Sporothrix eucalyptigena]|uniref:Regulatory protein leu3 n=1 Tax=Sporothrix eucalyptigena TaxID=1812306 RepID=A0ABP0CF71_9PEZI
MKAKACVKCRQWKARCDVPESGLGPCARCRTQNLTCVFDASYKRLSKDKRMQQMASELRQLRQLRASLRGPSAAAASGGDKTPSDAGPGLRANLEITAVLPLPSPAELRVLATPGTNTTPVPGSTTSAASTCILSSVSVANSHTTPSSAPTAAQSVPLASTTVAYRSLGDMRFTRSQVERYFRVYFRHYHPHLPFKMAATSPDETYARSPLLFWIVCAVTSHWKQQAVMAPLVKTMISTAMHDTPYSVETIQALLIMCIWPFRTVRISDDPTQFYSSIAARMALQLNLHRPDQPYWPLRHGSFHGPHIASSDDDVRRTTWLACYVVDQIQATQMGVPAAIRADANLLAAVEHPAVAPVLARLCRVYALQAQIAWTIGTNAPTPTGMVSPAERPALVRQYLEQMAQLQASDCQQQHHHTAAGGGGASDIADIGHEGVRLSTLYVRSQLGSYALLADMPSSDTLCDLAADAEATACELIDVAHGVNMVTAPVYFHRAMIHAGFVLVRLLQLPYESQSEVLYDSIERVCQSLRTIVTSSDDLIGKACTLLQGLQYLQDKQKTPALLSRMGVSLFYDLMRVSWEQNLDVIDDSFDMAQFDWNTLGL